MKTRYIFTAITAALTLLMTGCQKEADHYLDEIKVSSSYLSIPVGGGSAKLVVTTTDSWFFEKVHKVKTGEKDEKGKDIMADAELPEWLTADRLNGNAGETTVNFSAGETLDGRTAEVRINCAGKTQIVNIIQGLATVEKATCADIIAGPESKTYMVTGTCVKIVNTEYGNWYIEDGTTDQEIQIYGTLDENGNEKNFLSWGIEVGDEVTVQGPKSIYKGLVELVNVTVLDIQKSLIKVDSVFVGGAKVDVAELPLEGDKVLDVYLTCKGDGVDVEVPEEAKGWLSIDAIKSGANPVVSLKAARNDLGDRSTTVVFKTHDAKGKEYTSELAITQKGAIMEVSIADFLAAEVGDTQYRLTGVIVSNYDKDSQGQSFTIRDWSGETLVYRLNDYKASGAGVGDIITVVGKRGAYNDSPQMVSGVYEKHFSVKKVSIADFLKEPDVADSKNPDVFYMVTGTITSLKDSNGNDNDYGNLYISDGTDELYLYGLYPGWGASGDNRKGFVKAAGIKVGDTLTSIGYKNTWNGLVELCGGIYFSHEAGEVPPTPQEGITIDGDPSDWEGVANVVSLNCPADAELTGLQSAKILYSDKLYFLVKLSDEAIADGKVRLHIYFDTDNFGCQAARWIDNSIDYMTEGKMTNSGAFVEYASSFYKFIGTNPTDWTDYWQATDFAPAFESKGEGNWYELSMGYDGYPGGLPEQFNIGLDVVYSDWGVHGFLPQTSHMLVIKKDGLAEQPAEPEQPGEEGISVSSMLGLENNAAIESKESLVAAVTSKGFVATDGAKAIYVYTDKTDFNGIAKVGDKVKFSGTKTVYNGVHEVATVTAVDVVSSGNAVSYPSPKDVTDNAVDYTSEEAEYITFAGVLKVSGNYLNVEIDGVDPSGKQGSVNYPVNADEVKALDGKHLRFTGYFNGLSGGGKYLNIIATSIVEEALPSEVSITIDGNFDDWAGVPSAEPSDAFNAFKVWNDADNFYFYVETDPGSRLWSGGAYLYLYFNFKNDLTQGEYGGKTGMGEHLYDAYIYMYLFGGSADAPEIVDNPNNGTAEGMTMDNIVIAGNHPATSSDIVKMEIVIPRANFTDQVNAGDVIEIDSYRSKDGGIIYFPGYVVK